MRLSEAVATAPRIEIRVSGARGAASTVPGPPGAGDERVINAEDYGVAIGATAAANTAAMGDLIADVAGGTHPPRVVFPSRLYNMNALELEVGNIQFDLRGTRLIGPTASIVTSPAAPDVTIYGGQIIRTDAVGVAGDPGNDTAPVLHLNGPRNAAYGTYIEKAPEGGGYMVMMEYSAAGAGNGRNKLLDLVMRGGNGILIEGPGHQVRAEVVGRAVGADDCAVLKARNCATRDCLVEVIADGFSNVFAIGGEVGTLGAASPGRAGRVQNNRLIGIGRRCSFGLFCKPGAIVPPQLVGETVPDWIARIAAYNWRDGLVAGNFVHLQIDDELGELMERPAVMSASRGALVRGNKIIMHAGGRVRTNVGVRRVGLDFYIPDYSTIGAAAPTIQDNRCELHYDDPYEGVANGVGGAPGHPVQSFVRLEKETPAHGTFLRNRVAVFGRGCENSGIYLGPGCDDGLIVERADLDRYNTNGSNIRGGMLVESRLTVGVDINMSNGGGRPYVIGAAGDVRCPELERELYLHPQLNAGNGTETQYPYPVKRRAALIELTFNCASNFFTQDDVNYRSLEFRRNATLFHVATTKATGGTPESPTFGIAPGVPSTVYRLRDKTDAGNLAQCFFNEGDMLRLDMTEAGAGRTFVAPRLGVRAAPY